MTKDDNVQVMRDQGIADACAGREPLYVAVKGGFVSRGRVVAGELETRCAFAYTRAYEAKR
jgi:hypothetical protein